ncbi:hypothetical protein GUJ93_ZPchr0013g36062 [Zizania palustris]|uniref:Uncharacterized protein n=1 Tax=Zizania palustris TaxID=103762 RepID=A0A8J5X4C2_ZIZPA|nr:hypothetical protein GUJ93_ZPchr0013g36062 [Zizania palustris]
MGLLFVQRLDGEGLFNAASKDSIISRDFYGRSGRSYLFDHVLRLRFRFRFRFRFRKVGCYGHLQETSQHLPMLLCTPRILVCLQGLTFVSE